MKLAISIQGTDLNAPIDPRFGRARFFRIVDTETGQQSALDNTSAADAAQGAGIQTVQTLARLGVQAVLTGHVGPKSLTALQAAKIQVYPVNGVSAEQAVQSLLDGHLKPLSQVDAGGHWR
jgi:predicted Fe-Mo cluster-binding NifX family protein